MLSKNFYTMPFTSPVLEGAPMISLFLLRSNYSTLVLYGISPF